MGLTPGPPNVLTGLEGTLGDLVALGALSTAGAELFLKATGGRARGVDEGALGEGFGLGAGAGGLGEP